MQLYLEIEKQRFGNRLIIDINIEEKHLKYLVPFLLLQPVVENAIKFGLYGTTGECKISIQAAHEAGLLTIITKNPFDEDSTKSSKGTGFGLSSTARKLYLLFGRNDLLQTQTEGNIFSITIKIPQ